MKFKALDILIVWTAIVLIMVYWVIITKLMARDYEARPEAVESQSEIKQPEEYKPKSLGTRVITAYSSTPEETDDTPFITAYNTRVREGIVATNEFPMGTLLEIDGKVYEVQDKTNRRYKYRIDIWMPDKESALEWGRQIKEISIIKN